MSDFGPQCDQERTYTNAVVMTKSSAPHRSRQPSSAGGLLRVFESRSEEILGFQAPKGDPFSEAARVCELTGNPTRATIPRYQRAPTLLRSIPNEMATIPVAVAHTGIVGLPAVTCMLGHLGTPRTRLRSSLLSRVAGDSKGPQ
jgi:hypothetical protein